MSKRCRVSTACDECRLKKTKCNGKTPCDRCTANNSICLYNERVKKDTVYSVKEVELIETKLKLLTDALLKLSLMIKKDDKVLLNKVATRLDLGNQEDNIYLQVNEALSEFDNMGCYNSCRSNDIMTPSCSSSSIHSDPNTHYEKTLAHQLDSTLTSKSEKEKEPVCSYRMQVGYESFPLSSIDSSVDLFFPPEIGQEFDNMPNLDPSFNIPIMLDETDYMVCNELREEFGTPLPPTFLFDRKCSVHNALAECEN